MSDVHHLAIVITIGHFDFPLVEGMHRIYMRHHDNDQGQPESQHGGCTARPCRQHMLPQKTGVAAGQHGSSVGNGMVLDSYGE